MEQKLRSGARRNRRPPLIQTPVTLCIENRRWQGICQGDISEENIGWRLCFGIGLEHRSGPEIDRAGATFPYPIYSNGLASTARPIQVSRSTISPSALAVAFAR
jgi:hypothetical protein